MRPPTFMQRYHLGLTDGHDIDEYIERWHYRPIGDIDVSLHDYLGMTLGEHTRWVETGRLPERGSA